MDDEHSPIRLQAACHLGRGAEDVLINLATSGWHDDIRAEAAGALWKCDPDLVSDALLSLLEAKSFEVRLQAIYSAGKMRFGPARPKLLSSYKETYGTERGAMATALVDLSDVGDKEVEALLLDSLEDHGSDLPTPFIRGLGQIGTVDAVETLMRALAGAFGGDRQDRRVAKEAIMAIQSRAPGAEVGQVSLVEAEALEGALTLDGPEADSNE
jgi:HEAT repeat protein